MQLARIPKTSDCFGRYYTDQLVASLLVGALSSERPGLVIDLGCGEGALIAEARRKWRHSVCVSADIDEGAQLERRVRGIKHHTVDVLGRSIDTQLGVGFGTVDLALCNPPYVKPKWQKHFGVMLAEAGLSETMPSVGDVPAEVLFIAQNLRFLRPRGKLGLILPDGVVSGEKFVGLRTVLATSHRLEQVIELPRGVFRGTDAKAHILVISKNEVPGDVVRISRIEESGKLSPPIFLSPDLAAKRADYSHAIAAGERQSGATIGEVSVVARRGSHSSVDTRNSSFPVFHTTDFVDSLDVVPRKFILSKRAAENVSGVIAEAGDILVARVGRNLSTKVCVVPKGRVVISDCIILIRTRSDHQQSVFQFLRSGEGRRALDAAAHGVGARFITIEGLLGISLPDYAQVRENSAA